MVIRLHREQEWDRESATFNESDSDLEIGLIPRAWRVFCRDIIVFGVANLDDRIGSAFLTLQKPRGRVVSEPSQLNAGCRFEQVDGADGKAAAQVIVDMATAPLAKAGAASRGKKSKRKALTRPLVRACVRACACICVPVFVCVCVCVVKGENECV